MMKLKDAEYWIRSLNLTPHPEGGFFKETYRSKEVIAQNNLPKRFSGDRVFSTSIYFLLCNGHFSAFHRIRQDEIWHFYEGTSLTIHIISPDSSYRSVVLGRDIENDEHLQVIVPEGCLFAAEVNDSSSFCLMGCTVAPGFDFADFIMPSQKELLTIFPGHKDIIKKFSV